MNGFRLAAHEWKNILRSRKVMVSVIAVLLVPLLYSYLYLWAFWDPYERMNQLPVAVVNQDAGAEMNGEQVNIGADLVKKLAEDPQMKWDFISDQQARQGLEDGKYYMMIQIPPEFSKQVSTVSDNNPVKAEIRYIPNESRNLLSSQFGERAVESMRANVQKKITEKYTEAIFAKMGDAGTGLGNAADGAKKLADGLLIVKDGTGKLQNGAAEIATGAAKLGDGAARLHEAIQKLEMGLQQTSQGGTQVAEGLGQLTAKGLELSKAGVQLASGLDQANQAVSGITPKLAELNSGLSRLAPVSQDASVQWKALVQQHPELMQDPAAQKLAQEIGAISTGLPQSAEGSAALSGHMQTLQPSITQLAVGSKQLSDGIGQYAAGVGAAKSGADKVAAGDAKLLAGAGQLNTGAMELAAGGSKLADGGSRMQRGTSDLNGGVNQLVSGSNEMAAKLHDGAAEAKNGLQSADQKAQMIADPLTVQESKLHPVSNYGTGFSPYFISLALYVGALLLFIILNVHEVAAAPKRATAWLSGKFMVYGALGIVQAFIVAYLLQKGLGLQVASKPQFYVMCFLSSITFVVLIQGLISVLSEAGRFLAIVILMLQLTSSAGTFPLEMTPGFFRAINPYLPMTYTVAGLKSAIADGNTAVFWTNAGILLLFAAGIVLCTILLSLRRHPGSKNTNEIADNTATA